MNKMEDNAMNEQESGEMDKDGLVKKIQGGQGKKPSLMSKCIKGEEIFDGKSKFYKLSLNE